MAENKQRSQAERAASSKAPKQTADHAKKPAAVKPAEPKKNTGPATAQKTEIPVRLISSCVFIILFACSLIAFFFPEGIVPQLFNGLVHGLIGQTGFLIVIPALLYLFYVHAFSGKRPVKMRTVCLISFVLICGCLSHLSLSTGKLPSGAAFITELYTGGIDGTTGGLVCGCLAILIKGLCGSILAYIVLIVGGIFALLGGMQITIPSIIRAIQNRPRSEYEAKEEERQEPAAIVVNHIANKRIEYIERKRLAAEREAEELENDAKPLDSERKLNKRANDIMRQIDSDVEMPVAASETLAVEKNANKEVITFSQSDETIPKRMPELSLDEIEDIKPSIDPEIAEQSKKIKVTQKEAEDSAAEVAMEIAQSEATEKTEYCYPPIDLLKNSERGAADGTMEMRENTKRLNDTLASFKIEAHIINVTRGPSVTRYEVELEKGVRLSKLTTVADDIALSLGATGVRIAAVPGKISVVGIEVPNRAVTTVSLRDVIDSQEFCMAKSKSSFAVGKDIGGNCIVGNIAKLPHMLIAGTTGSGKSVCMNSIIISLLYKASPDDVKLIMVDPKMVELGIYNGIPHLLIPVVTDPKKAAGSLQWAVTEMMRRYKAMSDAGVRDLESYNSIIESQEEEGKKLPQVVVIIDELADLMLVAAKEVEESICRIAQMGRAAGIHLIIATQRPSADVITGLMKANIPSRIAFAVASAMESRIILDTQGAEKLVGKGDMLYAPIGNGKPKRVQGCFVSDPEVEAVASYVKSNFVTSYDQQVMEEIEKKAAQTGKSNAVAADAEPSENEFDGDEMLPAAVDVILETGQASVSMLQRRLKLGYARAARIVDEMEEKGIVGPFVGSKPRAILITKEQWQSMKGGQSSQMVFDDMEEDASSPNYESY